VPQAVTAQSLARRLYALPSVEMRRAVLREILEKTPAAESAPILEELIRGGRRAGAAIDVTLVTIVSLFDDAEGLNYDARAEIYRVARETGLQALSQLMLSELSTEPSLKQRPPQAGARPLTLGERKALARGPRGNLLDRLLLDPDPTVIRNVLGNPHVTEREVVRVAAHRPQNPRVFREILRSPRWSLAAEVRKAVVWNPDAPVEMAKRLLPLLDQRDLREVAVEASIRPPIRRAAQTILRVRQVRDDGKTDK
jgi:hypothetical protein